MRLMAYRQGPSKGKNTNKQYHKNSKQREIIKPTKLRDTLSINDTKYIDNYSFTCGNTVPIYEVYSVHAFNQLVGHAKFNNQNYGNVYYRGECKLHDSLKPSLFRGVKNIERPTHHISSVLNRILEDRYMINELKVGVKGSETEDRLRVEGMLQHYGIRTRFIDVVDNHWVALWMGLNTTEKLKQRREYYHYSERSIPLIEIANSEKEASEELFQYVLLIAVPFVRRDVHSGVKISNDYIEIDLRQALPSIFLRPHAQHGLVIRRKVHSMSGVNHADQYDMAQSVIGIIRIRIDRVHEWIGTGQLLSQDNLFPPPGYDYGYDLLLSREDLFQDSPFTVARYV